MIYLLNIYLDNISGYVLFVGSVMSLMAGLVFGGLSAYGAYNISSDSRDIKVSLCEYG